jgi:hypothetical protein
MSKQAAPPGNKLAASSVVNGASEVPCGALQDDAAPSGAVSANDSARPLPAYEPDDGPLTDAQMDLIRQMVPQGNYRPTRSLFLDLENEIWPPNAD